MSAKTSSTAGKIWYLLQRIHIRPTYIAVPVCLSLLSALTEGAGMGLLIPILNGFLQKSFAFVTQLPYLGPLVAKLPPDILANDRLVFGVLLSGFIGIIILKNILRFSSTVCTAYLSERCLHHLRKTLFGRYLSFGKLFFDTTNVGHHSMLLLEFSQLAIRPLMLVDKYMVAVFSLIVYLSVMFMISWRLTLVALPLFFVLHFSVKTLIQNVRRISRAIAERGSALGKKTVEILSTIPLVKSYRTEDQEQRRFTTISDEKARLDFYDRSLHALIQPMQEIITLLAAATIFLGSLYWFGRDQIASAPALVVYFYIVINASNRFGTLSGFRATLAAATGPLDEVLAIFDEEGKYFVRGGDKKFPGLSEAIEIRDLTFTYLNEREVLQNVSFTIRKGQMTALVGPTGAGKSTLIHLLMRYYDCPPASLYFDGTDVRTFTLDSYLEQIALVSQETLLLHDSLRNNITYGLTDVPDSVLQDVLRRSRLAHFIEQLPEGLNTLIGDRGVKLSGGEKQRVSIARALLRNAPILILDEATSALDSQTEKLIQEAIDEAVQGRTSIVIAHRLSTIKAADKIVVLDEGRMVEEGTLQELLDRKGKFFGLWEEQKF